VATKSPFGKGGETVVDESVRKTLQIDGGRVRFTNPAWHTAMEALVRDVAEALGCGAAGVKAKLYKLLLYEPGGFFKPHKVTRRALLTEAPGVRAEKARLRFCARRTRRRRTACSARS
jgi:hypothetical protein